MPHYKSVGGKLILMEAYLAQEAEKVEKAKKEVKKVKKESPIKKAINKVVNKIKPKK